MPNGSMIYAGTYAEIGEKHDHAIGSYSALLSADGKAFEQVTKYEFPTLEKQKNYSGYHHMYLKDILVNSMGEIFLVSSVNYMLGNGPYSYWNKDIMVICITPDGKQKWMTKVVRQVDSDNPVTGTVQAVMFKDKLYLFTVDSDEQKASRKSDPNKEIKSRVNPKNYYSAYFMFDEDGKFKQKGSMKSDKSNKIIRGNRLEPIGNDQYITMGSRAYLKGGVFPVRISFAVE